VRPLDAAPPGNPLEELRQRLYPEHPQHKLPREVFALRRRAWEVGCGPIADDYLEDHLKAWPPPWHKPACPCQSWGRWLKELPTEDLEQERWLETLAQAPCAGLPCAQQARLLGPLPQGEPHGAPPREFPLCGELHLRRGDQGELERAAPQDADLRIYRRGDAWSLQPLRAGAPAVSVQGQPAPGGPLEVLRLSAGQRVQIGAQLWQVAGELLGYLRVEYAWDQALEPVHHALFARDILVGRRAADPQDQRRQWITLREASVSRDHCRLEYALGRFLVSDQRSTGGTFLNGRKLTGKALLRAGRDTLQVGDFHLTLVRALPAQEASGAGQGQDL
jgi:hypothetical protein